MRAACTRPDDTRVRLRTDGHRRCRYIWAANMRADISLEELSSAIAAIHAAAAFPERWPDACSAVARLVNMSQGEPGGNGGWERLLGLDDGADDPQGDPATDPSTMRIFALLAPHLRAARQVRRRLTESWQGNLALASLDRLAVAAFIVDGAGAVQHLNVTARALVSEARCVTCGNGYLRFNERTVNAAFEAALRRATQHPPRASHVPPASNGGESYEVTVSPLEAEMRFSWPAGFALVVVSQPHLDVQRVVQRARSLYGLTDAEARVMAELTLGRTVEDIACRHGVRASTVRAQIRTIFEKTRVNRQADLVRLALAGAPLLVGQDS